jgi:hypothetical protein
LSSKRRKNAKHERKKEYIREDILSLKIGCLLYKRLSSKRRIQKVEEVNKRVRARSKHGTPGSTVAAQVAAERKVCRRTECQADCRLKIVWHVCSTWQYEKTHDMTRHMT